MATEAEEDPYKLLFDFAIKGKGDNYSVLEDASAIFPYSSDAEIAGYIARMNEALKACGYHPTLSDPAYQRPVAVFAFTDGNISFFTDKGAEFVDDGSRILAAAQQLVGKVTIATNAESLKREVKH